MILNTERLELRGVLTQTSKKGNTYYILHCEDMETGQPYKFFCKEFNALPQGLKKGDTVVVTVFYNSFKELEVRKVVKVA